MSRVRVCVFCGSSSGANPAYAEAASALGTALAERGIGVVYGGGDVGLMGTLADAALAAGGEVIGVIPEHLVRAEIAHPRLTQLDVVGSMHERKARMADLADGFVALPGGYGTLDELAEALTWTQLGLQAKPVVLLDVGGYFAPLFAFFDRAAEEGLVRPPHRQLAQRAATVTEAIERATGPVPDVVAKWQDRDVR